MRIINTVVIAAIIGIMAGAAVAYIEVRSDPDAMSKLADKAEANSPGVAKEAPVLFVPEPHYDFGTMQRGTSKSHEFEIRNTGAAPLKLRSGGTTCKCTLSDVPEMSVPPGGSTKVKLEWTAKSDSGPFRQTATILSNDLAHSPFELSVDGQIISISGVEPPEFLFNKLAVDETKSVSVYVMAMLQDELTVKDALFGDPTIREKFDVKIEPVERDALPNKLARRGVRVTVTAKPGLPIGRFSSWLTLHTDLPEASKLDIPVIGQVVGDIGIHGSVGWNEEQGVLTFGAVRSSEGGKRKVNIIVRGAGAPDIQFKVKSTDPEELKATIGQPKKLSDTLVQVPVEIEVPRGTHPMVRLETAQGEAGHIVFSTTHPKIKELALAVRFAVER